jgi:hypothetical protein
MTTSESTPCLFPLDLIINKGHSMRSILTNISFTSQSARLMLSLLVLAALSGLARADITGFGSFVGWRLNQVDSGSAPVLGDGSIRLTSQGGSAQARGLFYLTPQNVDRFTASFTYQAANLVGGGGYGAMFVLQNDPEGAAAIGGTAGSLAYNGINPSVAISLELSSGALSRSGLYTGGTIGGGANPIGTLDLHSGHPIDVTLTYDGAQHLTVNYLDTISLASFDNLFLVDIPNKVGSSTALVGLTASTGGGGSAEQYFSDFRYCTVPEPASISLLAAGAVAIGAECLRRKRRVVRVATAHLAPAE